MEIELTEQEVNRIVLSLQRMANTSDREAERYQELAHRMASEATSDEGYDREKIPVEDIEERESVEFTAEDYTFD